jgi:hypothetical protein
MTETAREYAARRSAWGEWRDTRHSFTVYRHAAERFRITLQRNTEIGFGLDHVGPDNFGKEFVEQIGDHLSISDLRDLIDHLADELAKQEAARHKRVSET